MEIEIRNDRRTLKIQKAERKEVKIKNDLRENPVQALKINIIQNETRI